MRFAEQKAHEATQIGALLGAISALPAAALVLGKDASPGAPLLVGGLILAVSAYIHWMATDTVFTYHVEAMEARHPAEPRLHRRGIYMSWMTFVYGACSLACSCAGLAAIHSTIRGPITVDSGFWVVAALAGFAIGHSAHTVHLRNKGFD